MIEKIIIPVYYVEDGAKILCDTDSIREDFERQLEQVIEEYEKR
jgi:hypothetical protein